MNEKRILTTRWSQNSGEWVWVLLGDVFPVVVGFLTWVHMASIFQGLVWGVLAWLVASYLLLPISTVEWLVAPSQDELWQIVRNFTKNARSKDWLEMAAGRRRFNLYCEILRDGTEYIGLTMPQKFWRGRFDDEMREGFRRAGASDIIERPKRIYIRSPRGIETEMALVEYLLESTDTSLDEVAVSPVSSLLMHVLTDQKPSSDKPLGEVRKK